MREAFFKVCDDAIPAQGFYVSLMMRSSRYGGPEEGGWWTSDTHIIAYKHFPTQEQARSAYDAVQALAETMSKESRDSHGEHCLHQMEWLDSRGLDADFLPENDGPNDYYVLMTESLPTESRGPSHYE
jgi:hypothetical protein